MVLALPIPVRSTKVYLYAPCEAEVRELELVEAFRLPRPGYSVLRFAWGRSD